MFLARLQMLTCLMVCAPSAHAIMVKFGTKGGPIEPPAPEPTLPVPQPYRVPAPVWEGRSDDTPDPNAHWRPQLFVPQPRYTQIVFNPSVPSQAPLNNAQRFVNSYIPIQQNVHKPIQAKPITDYFTPSQVLSSQALPGFGIRYFLPTYAKDPRQYKQEDAKLNEINTNEISDSSNDSSSDVQWKQEKENARRTTRTAQEGYGVPVYQWPVYVPSRHL